MSAMKKGGVAFDDHADQKWAEEFRIQAERNRIATQVAGATQFTR